MELDTNTPLGQVISNSHWLNMPDVQRNFWVAQLAAGVLFCGVTISPQRQQVEIQIDLNPRETVRFCITVSGLLFV